MHNDKIVQEWTRCQFEIVPIETHSATVNLRASFGLLALYSISSLAVEPRTDTLGLTWADTLLRSKWPEIKL